MFAGVLLDGGLLFFAEGTGPEFDVSHLLLLVLFDLLALLLENVLVELDDVVEVDLLGVSFQVLNLVLSDLLEALDGESVENFLGSLLPLVLERLEDDVSLLPLLVSDLLLGLLTEFALALLLEQELLLLLLLALLLDQLLLGTLHLELLFSHLVSFLIELFLDLHEDSLALSLGVDQLIFDLLEDGLELVAEVQQVLGHLGLLAESKETLVMGRVVDGSLDQALVVAPVQEGLDSGHVIEEGQHFSELLHLHVLEEGLALLEDSDGQSLGNERLVNGESLVLADGLEGSLTLLGDDEGRGLVLH
mmetsp:Transcript_15948/g.24679  ORF Transcript_15948/g.24679 Transcript_15948/m.24679 type:complete len:305 (+) Transcript_15948:834-1748(+)